MIPRESFGYVVAIDGSVVRLNLLDAYRGYVAAHRDGVTSVTQMGELIAVDGGSELLVLRVVGLSFAEPRDAHRQGVASTMGAGEPLRFLDAIVVGRIVRSGASVAFVADSLATPALGAGAFALSTREAASILAPHGNGPRLQLGRESRDGDQVDVALSSLLSRHVAVLGSTGQGKSCFTAAMIQQMLVLPRPRIVVFDINGEYEKAFEGHVDGAEILRSTVGGSSPTLRIPYYALGRHGLSRLLLPSERTQRPALAFALKHLRSVKSIDSREGVALSTAATPTLFDDCRDTGAREAFQSLESLRADTVPAAAQWPHMRALGCLVAESHAIRLARNGGYERNAWQYENVSPLITRIHRYTEDEAFTSVIDVEGGPPAAACAELSWKCEGAAVCDRIFGASHSTWKIHVVNLRGVSHDLMPVVLGSLLELFAFELFRRGQSGTFPTLLVLEEAHHYLRPVTEEGESPHVGLAYERLAKEGRKFGVSLWLSTQRPSEVSSTVLAQCGTWVTFRLASGHDLKTVESAGEWVDRRDLSRIAGLPRQEALVFGASIPIPVRVVSARAHPIPRSSDPEFDDWGVPGGNAIAEESRESTDS